ETLNHDRLVLTDQFGRKLVLIVSSSVGDAGMDLGHTTSLLLAVLRALLLAGKPPLCTRQLFCGTFGVLGVLEGLSIRGRHHRFETEVDADLGIFLRKRGDLLL